MSPLHARVPSARSWALLAALVALASAREAQVVKLNGPLAQPSSGDVLDYRLSPDGTRVIFRADQLTDGVYELFSAPADGSAPAVRLNDPLPPGGDVGGYSLNVFGATGWDYDVSTTHRVVYVVDQNTNDVDELYSVPDDGSASPVRLNGALRPGGSVYAFWLSPDGTGVVYEAEQLESGTLFRVPIDGTAPPTLLTPNQDAGRVWISPDGAQAIFTVSVSFGTRQQVYSVPTDGSSAPVFLALTHPPIYIGFTSLADVSFSDDGTRAIAYELFDEDGLEKADLYSLWLDASHMPLPLNQFVVGPYTRPTLFDGVARVVFEEGNHLTSCLLDGTQRVHLEPPGWAPNQRMRLTDDRTTVVFSGRSGLQAALYRVPVDGSSSAVQLVPPGPLINTLEIAGTTVVYTVGSSYFSVPLSGGTPLLLNPAPFDGSSATIALHPGGHDLLFLSEGGVPGVMQLFTVPLDASAPPRRLSAPLIPFGDVTHIEVAGAGEHVAYLADQANNETFELFGAPFAGGPVLEYSGSMPSGPVVGDVDSFVVTADERRVVYRADQDQDGVPGLFVARTDARGEVLRLQAGLPEGNYVFDGFAVDPAGTRAAFLYSNSPGSAAGYLYSASLTGAAPPIQLDDPSGLHGQDLVIDPTGTLVLYRKDRSFLGPHDLRSVRLDGTGIARTLNALSGDVTAFRVSPDGSVALYLSDQSTAGRVELYRVPTDGSAAPVKLNTPLIGAGDVTDLGFSPDGLTAVYLADANVDEQFELFSTPSDGSGSASQLNGPLVAGGDVKSFLVTPDGATVLYLADQRVDQTPELFAAPIGGGPAVLLAPLPAGRAVQADFTTTADGAQVLFRANPSAPLRFELFRVPTDGSASPVQASGTLVAGGAVSAFALAPDQSRILYLADQTVDNVVEPYSVPLLGGPSVRLHALPANAHADTLSIAPDSGHVCYRADANAAGVFELFTAPLDGSSLPERLNRPLPPAGRVQKELVALSDGRAVYLADQDEDDVFELFEAFLEHDPRGAATPTRMVTVGR